MSSSIQKLLSVLILFFCTPLVVFAATPTIITDADALDRSRNFVFNGSFEEPHLEMGAVLFGIFDGIDGDGYYWLSAITNRGPEKAVPDGWFTSGGGDDTYARWGNNLNAFDPFPEGGQAWSSPLIDGERSVYLGNFTPLSISETPAFMPNGEVVFNDPPIIELSTPLNLPPNPALCCYGPDPFTISQTVSGLIPGRLYRMSFWVSGEWALEAYQTSIGTEAGDGMMALDVEGYDRLYLTIPAGFAPEPPGAPHVFGTDEFHVYTLEFTAVDTDMDISFVNWGHFGGSGGTVGWTRGNSTEAVIDDVIINAISLPRNVPTLSQWGLIVMVGLLGITGLMVIRKRQLSI